MTTDGKNPAAQALGKLGGEARMKSLDGEGRSEFGARAVNARWEKERKLNADRPKDHEVVKKMLDAIAITGKPHTLYSVRAVLRYCESGSTFDVLWGMLPENKVGVYCSGAKFTDILSDVLATGCST